MTNFNRIKAWNRMNWHLVNITKFLLYGLKIIWIEYLVLSFLEFFQILCNIYRQGIPGFTASINLKDVNGLGEFQGAFQGLSFMKRRATPWDGQLEPLWAYLTEKDHFKATVTPHNYYRMVDPGILCSTFTDHVLHTNASRFVNKMPHLTKIVSIR